MHRLRHQKSQAACQCHVSFLKSIIETTASTCFGCLFPDSRRTTESKRHNMSARQVPEGSQHAAVQTDLHSPAAAYDPAYEWNLWSIRRRAVALTNLRHKATRSAQTESSRFRRHTATQVRFAESQRVPNCGLFKVADACVWPILHISAYLQSALWNPSSLSHNFIAWRVAETCLGWRLSRRSCACWTPS